MMGSAGNYKAEGEEEGEYNEENCDGKFWHAYRIEIFTFASSASATFLKTETVGLYVPDSRREIADCFVPILRASSFCVSPFSILLWIIILVNSNPGASSSYALLIALSFKSFVFSCR